MWTRGSTIEMVGKDVNSPVRFRAHGSSANLFNAVYRRHPVRGGVREIRNSLQLKSFRLRDRQ